MSTIVAIDRGSNVFYQETGAGAHGRPAGDARHADSAHTPIRPRTRTPDWQAHSAYYRRLPANAAWVLVSRAASAREEGLGCFQMGDGAGPQPGIQVLPADGQGQEATRGGRVAVE